MSENKNTKFEKLKKLFIEYKFINKLETLVNITTDPYQDKINSDIISIQKTGDESKTIKSNALGYTEKTPIYQRSFSYKNNEYSLNAFMTKRKSTFNFDSNNASFELLFNNELVLDLEINYKIEKYIFGMDYKYFSFMDPITNPKTIKRIIIGDWLKDIPEIIDKHREYQLIEKERIEDEKRETIEDKIFFPNNEADRKKLNEEKENIKTNEIENKKKLEKQNLNEDEIKIKKKIQEEKSKEWVKNKRKEISKEISKSEESILKRFTLGGIALFIFIMLMLILTF